MRMAHSIENVKDINDSKDLWKFVVRIRHLWSVTNMSNKEHLKIVIMNAKVRCYCISSQCLYICCFKYK